MAGEGVQFIRMALDKQQRRADNEREDERIKNAEIAQALQGIANLAGVIGGGVANRNSPGNMAANAALNRIDPPRAEAVDPDLARSMAAAGMGPTKPHIGGIDELRMNMALQDREDAGEDRRFKRGLATAEQDRLAAGAEENKRQFDATRGDRKEALALNLGMEATREKRLEDQLRAQEDEREIIRKAEAAKEAARHTDDKTKQAMMSSDAYFKKKESVESIMAAAQRDGNFALYNSKATELQALYYGQKNSGAKELPPLNIPPFIPPGAEKDKPLIEARQAWDAAKERAFSDNGKGWTSIDWRNLDSAGDVYMGASKTLYDRQQPYAPKEVEKYTPPVSYNSPDSVKSAVSSGALSKQQGLEILRRDFGMQ